MKHPPAERWTELERLGESEREALSRHAETCEDCARARDRVLGAKRALGDLRAAAPPDLSWDLLGARLHWTVSSELKRKEREAEKRPRWMLWLAGGAATLIAAGAAAALLLRSPPVTDAPPIATPVVAPAQRAGVLPPPSLEGVVTLLQGESILDSAPLFLDSPIHEGTTLRTSAGRVAVQLGDRSGFVVEENTTLELSRLDDSAVELRILSGAVAVDLTRRRSDQRFAVLAGDRSVEVRGTAFRVALADEALDVMVARGLVAVIEDADAVEVAAGGRLAIPKGGSLADHLPRRLSDREAKDLARAVRAPFVPAWTAAPEVRAATAVLRVAAGPRARVRVDDVEVGVGTLSLRTVAGRHLVEAGAVSRWVELDAGVVAMTELVDPRSERPAQLDAQVKAHEQTIAVCAQRARKQDPLFEGQVVEIDVQVGADGSVVSVNSGNSEIENCVAEIARNTFAFPRGSRGTVRKRINVR